MQHDETYEIRDVAERLIRRHPKLPAETVIDAVAGAHQRFADLPIRDFIPLVVERMAHRDLKVARALVRTGPLT